MTRKEARLSEIITSLVRYDVPIELPLKIYIDGKVREEEQRRIIEMLSAKRKINQSEIEVYAGDKFDERVEIVNLADEIANWLFRKPLSWLSENKRLCKLERM